MTVMNPPSGGDDTAALQALFDTGGVIPDQSATYLCSKPLFYSSNTTVQIAATIAFDNSATAWPNTNLIGPKYSGTRLANFTLDMTGGGQIVGLSANSPTTAGGQHGLVVGFTDGFTLIWPRVTGVGNRNLFAIEIRQSTNGTIKGGYASHQSVYQGADGIHFVGNCSDIAINELYIESWDDSSSQTLENSMNEMNSVIERITYTDCTLRNTGHSSVKGLILASVGNASVIRNISYSNCDMETIPTLPGAGAPVWICNQNSAAIIDQISIAGGNLHVQLNDPSQNILGPHLTLQGVSNFSLTDTDVEFYGRQLLVATNCPNLVFQPKAVRVTPGYMVSAPSQPTALINLQNCPGYDIDQTKLVPAYPGQQLLAVS